MPLEASGLQHLKGNRAGSWDAVGVWDEAGGRVLVTALNAMALQAAARRERLVVPRRGWGEVQFRENR